MCDNTCFYGKRDLPHLEDNNHTEEIDPGDETEDGEDADVVRVVQPKLGRAPEYCHNNPDLKQTMRIGGILTEYCSESI